MTFVFLPLAGQQLSLYTSTCMSFSVHQRKQELSLTVCAHCTSLDESIALSNDGYFNSTKPHSRHTRTHFSHCLSVCLSPPPHTHTHTNHQVLPPLPRSGSRKGVERKINGGGGGGGEGVRDGTVNESRWHVCRVKRYYVRRNARLVGVTLKTMSPSLTLLVGQ